jgi:hypothetical protein
VVVLPAVVLRALIPAARRADLHARGTGQGRVRRARGARGRERGLVLAVPAQAHARGDREAGNRPAPALRAAARPRLRPARRGGPRAGVTRRRHPRARR